MKASELREMSVDTLKNELMGLLREQFNLRMQKSTGQMTKSHSLKAVRRNIARIKMVLSEKTGTVL